MNLKKIFNVFVLSVFLLAATTACTKDEGKSSDTTVYPTKISLTGLTGEGTQASPYVAELEEGTSSSYDVTVTPTNVTNLQLSYNVIDLEGNGVVTTTNSTNASLTVNAVTVGEAMIEISAPLKEGKLSIYVSVNVVPKTVVTEIKVTKILIPSFENGDGTFSEPYQLSVANSQSETVSFTVQPSNATNKALNWKIGKIADGAFVEETNDGISIEATNLNIKVNGLTEGAEAIIEGSAVDGSGVKVYILAVVEEFTSVTSISSTKLLEKENAENTYVFETAAGTWWDMSTEQLARGQELLDGNIIGGNQAPLNLTYWPTLYNFGLDVLPSDATDPTLLINYSEEGIFRLNTDGSWEALKEGTTVVTVSSYTNPTVSINIEVTVNDSLYSGITMDAYNELAVSDTNDWNFDKDADNLEYTLGILGDWQLVQVQSNSERGVTGDDGNQKIFYLGTSERVYGICLESRVDKGNLANATALMWTKATIGEQATTLDVWAGNNDKTHGEFRVLMVDENKNVYIVNPWQTFDNPIMSSKYTFDVPEEVKGKTVAIVIEQRLKEANNNAELQIKGVVLNQYTAVTDLALGATSGEYGQGGSFTISNTITPANATNKNVSYAVTPANNGVTVNDKGVVVISLTAEVGEYTITVTSVDNPEVSAVYNLTVMRNVPTTGFEILGIDNGQTITATYDSNGKYTDSAVQIVTTFNEEASDTTFTVSSSNEAVVVFENNKLVYKGIGTSTVIFTPNGNVSLAITITVTIEEYSENSAVIAGINKTEISNTTVSQLNDWTMNLDITDWKSKNVNQDHSGSKVANDGRENNEIVLEGHSTKTSFTDPINIIWNKLAIGNDINSFIFKVAAHSDSRVLESSNFRVRVVEIYNNNAVKTLLGWTTVANRYKFDGGSFYEISLDISMYQGKEIAIVIEQTGSLQNNGDFPVNSDSAAGAYLHIAGIKLSTSLAKAIPYEYNLYSNNMFELPVGWTSNANKNTALAKTFTLSYLGQLNTNAITLSSASMFINGGAKKQPTFYAAGLYKALDNRPTYEIIFEITEGEDVVSLANNVLTPLKEGVAILKVFVPLFENNEETVAFEVKLVIEYSNEDPTVEEIFEWIDGSDVARGWKATSNVNVIGEGIDLVAGPSLSETPQASISKNITISKEHAVLSYDVRVFVRSGETYPRIVVLVNDQLIRAKESNEDYAYCESDDYLTFTYDLSSYIDQNVKVVIGALTGTHCAIKNVKVLPMPKTTNWPNKDSILLDWTVTGQMDAGVGEGVDIQAGSTEKTVLENYISYTTTITESTKTLSYNVRVFVRSGETYPKLVVYANDVLVRAVGAETDTVYCESDDFLTFTYDLQSFVNQEVTIKIGALVGTHCVIGAIALK